jgi:hypothetical protein
VHEVIRHGVGMQFPPKSTDDLRPMQLDMRTKDAVTAGSSLGPNSPGRIRLRSLRIKSWCKLQRKTSVI